MTRAHVTRPSIALPEHEITTDEICADIQRAHPDLPRLGVMLRYARRTQVATRRFTRPLSHRAISGDAPIAERNQVAFTDAAELAVRAAKQTLAQTGLTASNVDCVVTSHTSSWTVPGLDVHLIEELGLRPDVRRIPMSTLGCVGGAQALAKAADHVTAHPGSTVLVVVAEMLSTVYNHADANQQSVIYKTLFGDSAGACLVTDTPPGPGLQIDSTWEYLLPRSRERYSGRLDASGLHFDSEKSATEALNDVMPALQTHLGEQRLREVEFAVIHPGGPRVLEDAERGLGIDQEPKLEDKAKLTRHSWSTLREDGNLGGVAVLSVLSRTHDDPPADGARGLLLGVGPGFSATACTATWTA
ncbi:PhlD [Streptomyces sp. NPDC060064]|uniref:PhlD n=1 Tax=Streptomyces sp. NPDC060064 TaxID=3347049 RepID=UPI0036ABE5FB